MHITIAGRVFDVTDTGVERLNALVVSPDFIRLDEKFDSVKDEYHYVPSTKPAQVLVEKREVTWK